MLLERPETAIPTEQDAALAAKASRLLAKTEAGTLRIRLDDGEELTLPSSAARLLAHLLTEMSQGNAVTLIPLHAELTTQQAAEILNVSRPHIVKLIEEAKLPHRKVGSHRRVKFTDLEAYKASLQQRHNQAMEELAEQAQTLGMGY